MAQGDNKTGEKGTNSIYVLDHEQIKNIPKDHTITYTRMVVDYRPPEGRPKSGNLLSYPGELTFSDADWT